VGTGLVLVALLGVPIVAAAAMTLSARSTAPGQNAGRLHDGGSTLTVRLGIGHPQDAIESLLALRAPSWSLASITTARQGAAIDLVYSLPLADLSALAPLVMEMNAVAGVQSVDLRKSERAE
jgi:hypothetical protein